MNETEHLLTILAEEAAEVAQACCKALRFGLEDTNPNTGCSARLEIQKELLDLLAVADMLVKCGVIADTRSMSVEPKQVKVAHFMGYARECGALEGHRDWRGIPHASGGPKTE